MTRHKIFRWWWLLFFCWRHKIGYKQIRYINMTRLPLYRIVSSQRLTLRFFIDLLFDFFTLVWRDCLDSRISVWLPFQLWMHGTCRSWPNVLIIKTNKRNDYTFGWLSRAEKITMRNQLRKFSYATQSSMQRIIKHLDFLLNPSFLLLKIWYFFQVFLRKPLIHGVKWSCKHLCHTNLDMEPEREDPWRVAELKTSSEPERRHSSLNFGVRLTIHQHKGHCLRSLMQCRRPMSI